MKYRTILREFAVGQYGYITTPQARELDVPTVELSKLAARGGLTHVAYGLYRFDDVPPTRYDQYMEAVLRVGHHAYLTHDAVLSLHNLALVNPSVIRVGTPKRTWAHHPEWLQVIKQMIPPEDLTVYEGIPSVTVRRALLDCRGMVMADRLLEAAEEAAEQGLLRRREVEPTLTALRDSQNTEYLHGRREVR